MSDAILLHYDHMITRAVDPYRNTIDTPLTRAGMMQSVLAAQREFLNYYRDEYVPKYPAKIHFDGGNVLIAAPICTRAEKFAFDQQQEAARQMLADIEAENLRQLEILARRTKNMERQRRRLWRKHYLRIGHAMSAVLSDMTHGQQYAYLKDIDYEVRHGLRK